MEDVSTLILNNPYRDFKAEDVLQSLRSDVSKSKISALTKIITAELNGDHHPELLMEVIRMAMPCPEHQIKRLVLIYLESIQKTENGQLKPELILAINGLLQDLNHPNEYIRGVTLKFLCHVSERGILQPLVNAVVDNMTHKHVYVRKAAANEEKDSSARVCIFSVLTQTLPEFALKFLVSIAQQITTFSELFVMTVLKFIRLIQKSTPAYKGKYTEILSALLTGSSDMVRYEAASLFPMVTGNAHAVVKSVETLVDVICATSDVNVKITGVQRIKQIANKYKKVVKGNCVAQLLRMLTINAVRGDVLSMVIGMIAPRNAGEIASALKKESVRENNEYVINVISALKKCKEVNENIEIDEVMFEALKEPELAKEVLGYIETRLRGANKKSTIEKLLELISEVKESKTMRSVIWMICEYAEDKENVLETLKELIVEKKVEEQFVEQTQETEPQIEEKKATNSSTSVILADGSYGSATSNITETQEQLVNEFSISGLKELVNQLDGMVISVIAGGVIKLVLKTTGATGNKMRAKALQIIIEILKVEKQSSKKLPEDVRERVKLAIGILSGKGENVVEMSEKIEKEITAEMQNKTKISDKTETTQIDEKIRYELFSTNDDEEVEDVTSRIEQIKESRKLERLNNIVQLTGYSDPFYIEAVVTVTHFDITLDCLVINQTPSTLQNINIELIPHGGMSVKTKPAPVTLGPGDFVRVTLGVKVDATTVGVISGYVNYDISDKNVTHHALDANLILNELRIEYLDQMTPCPCDREVYQKKWMEYEWENKIPIDTELTDLKEYAFLVSSIAKLQCITPTVMFCDSIGFLSANFYAKNLFDEDALVNISAEAVNGKISGWIRIRSKTQSLAINLGDRIVANQKKVAPK
ncbi:coatomer beta subunit, putative [Entamoeba invadens IP1]|uniref:Coatomer subunit beta n=1 Tax=Entamoeba invadens IP1 TaxID=370355 RepID=A0A0A1U7C6_ENTIV|nr:coatomer beta subunit, putative [Entamoeba invadens IP1]ELP88936.1 coatomer beta subunit, putative [Entamoeba invadens IP1]|eukprot:XP_004255707.1 coatomer beta subunit, putative [Entamoeba invadens IP1]